MKNVHLKRDVKVVPNIEYVLEKPEDTLIRPNEDEQNFTLRRKRRLPVYHSCLSKDFPLTIRHAKPGDKIALDASETKHQNSKMVYQFKIPLEERKKFGCWKAPRKKIRAILGYRYTKPLFL